MTVATRNRTCIVTTGSCLIFRTVEPLHDMLVMSAMVTAVKNLGKPRLLYGHSVPEEPTFGKRQRRILGFLRKIGRVFNEPFSLARMTGLRCAGPSGGTMSICSRHMIHRGNRL